MSERGKTIIGRVIKNAKGFAFVNPEPTFRFAEDVFLDIGEAISLVTGDRVEIRINPLRSHKGYHGKLLRILERGLKSIVGRYIKNGRGHFAEIHAKDLNLFVEIANIKEWPALKPGSAVLITLLPTEDKFVNVRGNIIKVLADSMDNETDDLFVITKNRLHEKFLSSTMHEAAAVPQTTENENLKDRKDLRHLAFVTIDGEKARDFDDAVFVELLKNGKYRLYVAIADVAHYVKPGSAIDKEAYQRATSVYFPHRVLPMLPEALSNGICSLNPDQDRLAMVCEIDYERDGQKISHTVYNAIFRSKRRCTYEEVQNYLDEPHLKLANASHEVIENLKHCYQLYKKSRAIRIARGTIDLDLPEAAVEVDDLGQILNIQRSNRFDAHRLIEEFMIAANEAVSEIMLAAKRDFIFRVHDKPEADAVYEFLKIAQTSGVSINNKKINPRDPRSFQIILEAIRNLPHARSLHFLLLRSLKQAVYSDQNIGHFGLASRAYTHFTSPIRRYPDLMVHRLLKAYLNKTKKLNIHTIVAHAPDLAAAALHCSQQERVAMLAEREMIRMKQVRYAEKHLGETFMGTVINCNNRGFFVELDNLFIEGFVDIDTIGNDFRFVESELCFRTRRSGKRIRMGDRLEIQIARTNPQQQQIELAVIEFLNTQDKQKNISEKQAAVQTHKNHAGRGPQAFLSRISKKKESEKQEKHTSHHPKNKKHFYNKKGKRR